MSQSSFHTTRWSVVVRAADSDRVAARRALGELCEAYWFPLYAFLRRIGQNEADAWDAVQSFCAELIDRGGLGGADRGAGAFRDYLVGALRHFLSNRHRAEQARKRGGGAVRISVADAEARYSTEFVETETPERAYERCWALAVLERATAQLRADYEARGKQALLAALEPALLNEGAVRLRDVAASLGISEGAAKVALHRLRGRMRERVRDEVLQTLHDPSAVDDELRRLFAALST